METGGASRVEPLPVFFLLTAHEVHLNMVTYGWGSQIRNAGVEISELSEHMRCCAPQVFSSREASSHRSSSCGLLCSLLREHPGFAVCPIHRARGCGSGPPMRER